MTENPYVSPQLSAAVSRSRHSRKIYMISSLAVLAFWSIAIVALGWYTTPTIENREIFLHIPGKYVSTTPTGDPMITYDAMYYTTTKGAFILVSIAMALSLGAVNGMIKLLRCGGRLT